MDREPGRSSVLVPNDSRLMIRFRNLAIVTVLATVIYALIPAARKARFFDKLREFGRALVLSLILYWVLILGRAYFAG